MESPPRKKKETETFNSPTKMSRWKLGSKVFEKSMGYDSPTFK